MAKGRCVSRCTVRDVVRVEVWASCAAGRVCRPESASAGRECFGRKNVIVIVVSLWSGRGWYELDVETAFLLACR